MKPDSGTGGSDAGDAKADADASEVKADADAATDTTDVKPETGDAGDASEAGDASDASPEVNPCGTTPVCTLAAKRCDPNGGGVETCIMSGGCPAWSTPVACGGHQMCTNGACGCIAEPRCSVAGAFCDNGNLGACSADGACLFVSTTPAACAAGKVCGGAAGSGACSCAATACNGTASVSCLDTATVRTCAASDAASGCIVPTDTACGDIKVCSGGMCQCPAKTGTHVGEGCMLGSPAICEGANILTCTHDDPTTCDIWKITDQCNVDASSRANSPHPGDLTCGTGPLGTGPAACQCNANSTTTVYVDPVAGSDAVNSPRYPTGVLEPPICRFATITHGMGVSGVTKVIAVSDNAATTPVSFTGETFPMTVKSSVILSSMDNDPTHYSISVNSGALGIQLSSESVVSGFTLSSDGVTGSTVVFPSSAHAKLDTVVIKGNGTVTHGVNIGPGTGTADLNAVTVDHTSGSAIEISANSVNISGSKGNNSPTGLHVSAGTVTVTSSSFDSNNIGVQAESSALAIVNLSGTSITKSATAGISVSQGAIVADQGTSIDSGKMGDGIVASNGAHVTLTGTKVIDNNTGITSTGSTTIVSITAGAAIDHNKLSGIVASNLGTSPTPGLSVGGSTSVGLNGGDGIVLTGAIATIAGADIHENVNGIHVVSPSGSAVVQIGGAGTTTTVEKNSAAGILVEQSPVSTQGNASSLFVDTTTVDANGGIGIDLSPSNAATVFATVKSSTITNNHGTGIVVAGTRAVPGGQTDTSFSGNNVASNGFSALTDSVGGILFDRSSTLSAFVGNSVHDNNGNQVAFNNAQIIDVARSITTTWKISAPTCDSPPSNKIYHYSGAGLVGLRVAGGVSVDASNVHWQDSTPIAGTDISNTGMITAEPHCMAAP